MARRILIIEPDPHTAQELFLVLHREGGSFQEERYEADIASSLAEAVEKAQSTRFHCIILDVNLPEMKGYEAVRLMRRINNNSPIVMVAVGNTAELETKVREQGVFYYHIAPFNQQELRLAIQSVFDKLPKLVENRKLGIGTTKPISLKPLRLFRKQDKQPEAPDEGLS